MSRDALASISFYLTRFLVSTTPISTLISNQIVKSSPWHPEWFAAYALDHLQYAWLPILSLVLLTSTMWCVWHPHVTLQPSSLSQHSLTFKLTLPAWSLLFLLSYSCTPIGSWMIWQLSLGPQKHWSWWPCHSLTSKQDPGSSNDQLLCVCYPGSAINFMTSWSAFCMCLRSWKWRYTQATNICTPQPQWFGWPTG